MLCFQFSSDIISLTGKDKPQSVRGIHMHIQMRKTEDTEYRYTKDGGGNASVERRPAVLSCASL